MMTVTKYKKVLPVTPVVWACQARTERIIFGVNCCGFVSFCGFLQCSYGHKLAILARNFRANMTSFKEFLTTGLEKPQLL
jgi:hypothetical protein